MRTIQLPIIENCLSLTCHIKRKITKAYEWNVIIMAGITKEQEHDLDKGKSIKIKHSNGFYEVGARDFICYGEVDFSTNSSDYKQLYSLIKNVELTTIIDNYDYVTNTCKSNFKCYQTIDTSDIAKIAQYVYGRLGKPDRIVIFKYTS